MKFSFLMCVNKSVPQLSEAIDSVLGQSDPDFLFHIVANNCDDELWVQLCGISDPRVRLYRTLVGQLAFNLNFGLNIIGDGYVLRMDADDLCAPDRLAITRSALCRLKYPDVLAGAAVLIDTEGRKLGRVAPPLEDNDIRRRLWLACPIVHPACAIKVSSILKLGGYLGGFMSEDYDLWLRAARVPWFRFAGIAESILQYRVGGQQARGNRLGYSEVAGHLLREGLLGSGARYFLGSLIGIGKRYVRGVSV